MIKLSSDGPVVMVDDNGGDRFFVERCFDASKVPNSWLSFPRAREFLAMLEQVRLGLKPMPALVLYLLRASSNNLPLPTAEKHPAFHYHLPYDSSYNGFHKPFYLQQYF